MCLWHQGSYTNFQIILPGFSRALQCYFPVPCTSNWKNKHAPKYCTCKNYTLFRFSSRVWTPSIHVYRSLLQNVNITKNRICLSPPKLGQLLAPHDMCKTMKMVGTHLVRLTNESWVTLASRYSTRFGLNMSVINNRHIWQCIYRYIFMH